MFDKKELKDVFIACVEFSNLFGSLVIVPFLFGALYSFITGAVYKGFEYLFLAFFMECLIAFFALIVALECSYQPKSINQKDKSRSEYQYLKCTTKVS
ncbi:MAG: hypothetical protein V1860_02220 [bacterium]